MLMQEKGVNNEERYEMVESDDSALKDETFAAAAKSPYVYEVIISTDNKNAVIHDIEKMIREITGEVDETEVSNEFMVNVTEKQAAEVLEKIKEKYSDARIIGGDILAGGKIRISIE
jgi:hypothetical protein